MGSSGKVNFYVKRARLMMSMRANGLLRKSGTLPCHASVSRSRDTLPWHAPVARSRGTIPARARAPARAQAPRVTKPEILVEDAFTNGLRLKT